MFTVMIKRVKNRHTSIIVTHTNLQKCRHLDKCIYTYMHINIPYVHSDDKQGKKQTYIYNCNTEIRKSVKASRYMSQIYIYEYKYLINRASFLRNPVALVYARKCGLDFLCCYQHCFQQPFLYLHHIWKSKLTHAMPFGQNFLSNLAWVWYFLFFGL